MYSLSPTQRPLLSPSVYIKVYIKSVQKFDNDCYKMNFNDETSKILDHHYPHSRNRVNEPQLSSKVSFSFYIHAINETCVVCSYVHVSNYLIRKLARMYLKCYHICNNSTYVGTNSARPPFIMHELGGKHLIVIQRSMLVEFINWKVNNVCFS